MFSPVTENLLFLNEKQINERMCQTRRLISGPFATKVDMLLTELPCTMGCHRNHGISCNPNGFILGTILLVFKWSTEQFHVHEKLSLCKVGLISRSYSMFSLYFLVSLAFMNMQMRFVLNL